MAEEKFLSRWSRRKRAATREAPSPAAAPGHREISQIASPEVAKPAPAPDTSPSVSPVDAIDGNTDLRELLTEGVPTALTRAALRRAWASDPAIRDFVGLAENAWDFNAPDLVSGFGTVSDQDVRRLLAHAEQSGSASAETPSPAPAEETSQKKRANEERTPEPEPLTDENQSAVAQSEATEDAPSPPSVPRHGGALPK